MAPMVSHFEGRKEEMAGLRLDRYTTVTISFVSSDKLLVTHRKIILSLNK